MTPAEREERDKLLQVHIGMTWDEIAATHDMRCGACRGGVLRLDTVNLTTSVATDDMPAPVPGWRPAMPLPLARVATSVTLGLVCDRCGQQMAMEPHAKE